MNRRMDVAAVLRMAQTADPAAVADLVAAAARDFGASDVIAYLVDFEQLVLEPLPDHGTHADVPAAEVVAATMAGRAFLSREAVTVERHDGSRVWVPILEGSDRTGVVAMTVQEPDDTTLDECMDLGILAGYLIAAHARCTDVYQLHRRRKSMSLAASMQWDLLPPLVLQAPGCQVAARLEPAYEVGGDCFDYAVNGPVLDVALIDAMGHGVAAAAIAALAVGCYRHGRREGHGLEMIHQAIDEVVSQQLRGEGFATGQLARLELATGVISWMNAGHPLPLLIRNGQVIKELTAHVSLPWGLGSEPARPAEEALEPGDGVLFFTDGVIEARTPSGEEFGLGRLADLVGQCASNQLLPEEIVRQLVHSVLEHRHTHLQDDATVVLVEWSGPPG